MILKRNAKFWLLALMCAIMVSATSVAGEISETIFQIEASLGDVSDVFAVPLSSGGFDGDTFRWTLESPIPLVTDSGLQLGILNSASVAYVADPVVILNFGVQTGAAAANFTVTSANLAFANIPNARGRAAGSVTVTDNAGDGAALFGNFPNNDTFRSFYNDIAAVPATGTTFATLTPGVVSASPFVTLNVGEGFPDNAGNFSLVNEAGAALGNVTSMSAQWKFRVGANDSASGTGVFVIVPEPGSMLISVLGMLSLGLLRRR